MRAFVPYLPKYSLSLSSLPPSLPPSLQSYTTVRDILDHLLGSLSLLRLLEWGLGTAGRLVNVRSPSLPPSLPPSFIFSPSLISSSLI
jgi:hypothetical protein